MIYFDNAATTMPCEQAVEAAAECMRNSFGNASSLHRLGLASELLLKKAEKAILKKLSLEGEIIFTSGATESNNTALLGAAECYKRRGNRIVSTAIEHPSVAKTLDRLEQQGFQVLRLRQADFRNNFEQALIDAVDENTIILSFMAVNNETGFYIDSGKVYREVKRRYPGCVIHLDGVQGFCKIPLYGDLISLSAHKIHGTKGMGALYRNKSVRFSPLLYGGGQQNNLRSGTEPVELIAAFEAAVLAYPDCTEQFSGLQSHLLTGLKALDDVKVNSFHSIPSIVNFSVSGVRSEIMLHFLEDKEIYVSSGSACSRGKVSPVLEAMGINRSEGDSALRISFSRFNTEEQIDTLLTSLEEGIKRFRR